MGKKLSSYSIKLIWGMKENNIKDTGGSNREDGWVHKIESVFPLFFLLFSSRKRFSLEKDALWREGSKEKGRGQPWVKKRRGREGHKRKGKWDERDDGTQKERSGGSGPGYGYICRKTFSSFRAFASLLVQHLSYFSLYSHVFAKCNVQ